MNILLATQSMSASTGGPPRVVAGSAAALARQGARVTIAALSEPDVTPEIVLRTFPELATQAIAVRLFPRGFPGLLGRSPAMRTFFQPVIGGFDAVHVHGVWEGCLAELHGLASEAGLPFFVSAHGMLDRWSVSQSRWKKKLALKWLNTGTMLRGADAIIYGTEDERTEGREFVSTNSLVVPNGIHAVQLHRDMLPEAGPLLVAHPQLSSWKRTILYFSRVHPKKGLDLLLEAFLALSPDFPEAGLLIAGIAEDGAYEHQIRVRIAGSGLDDRVVFTTRLVGPPARAVFRKTDIFALPSHQEGFSMAVLEAMALGLPVLITDRCHLPQVESEWTAGLVVPDNLEGITRGLARLMRLSPEELGKMGERGRAAIFENYDWDAIARRLAVIYGRSAGTAETG